MLIRRLSFTGGRKRCLANSIFSRLKSSDSFHLRRRAEPGIKDWKTLSMKRMFQIKNMTSLMPCKGHMESSLVGIGWILLVG